MNKEDYMKFSKERLAELCVEMEDVIYKRLYTPLPYQPPQVPCYAPNGICVNPQHDCIGCPKDWTSVTYTSNNIKPIEQ